jgi:hypothetical protein
MHQVLNRSKQTKNDENMRLELLKGVKLFFPTLLKQTIIHPLLVFFALFFYFLTFKKHL